MQRPADEEDYVPNSLVRLRAALVCNAVSGERGMLTFDSMTASYDCNPQLVLHNLTASIVCSLLWFILVHAA